MKVNEAIELVATSQDLSFAQSRKVFRSILNGELTPSQIGGLLVGLRTKGETVPEIAGAARAMREASLKLSIDVPHLVDIAGTGGSGPNKLFNVSTASAFVAAATGAHVAKHGNRSVSSSSGSADVLEAAGIDIALPPAQVAQCIKDIGVGFLFAPAYHSAMRFAVPVRQELGVRTLFNLLGPLTNPSGTQNQVIGVFDERWQLPIAEIACSLGSTHVLVVHSQGLDEISVAGGSRVVELKDGKIDEYWIHPDDFGLAMFDTNELKAASPTESLRLMKAGLAGELESARALLGLNAGAAVYTCGLAKSLEEGVTMALDAIGSGAARAKLAELSQFKPIR